MAEKEKKTAKTEDSIETKVESSVPQKTVSGISGTKTLRVGRVNKKAKKPPVEEVDFGFQFSDEHLSAIEEKMKEIVKESLILQVYDVSKSEAYAYMKERNEPYKMELISEIPDDEKISFYKQGDYAEFCAGPHISNVSFIKAIKLLSVAGAYWRGSEKNPMLTRIYGISFPKASMLEEYLKQLEEAKARDHRKLGKELELFALMEEGPGLPFYFPKGLILKNNLIDYWRKIHSREGYEEISSPIMLMRTLWEKSGHWDHYRENMFTTSVDDTDYAIKPMNCPGGMLVYKSKQHSYKEFPMRVAELGIGAFCKGIPRRVSGQFL